MLALGFASAARSEEITLAVASNFTPPMQLLAKRFEQQSGHKVRLALGSSGKFYAQIRHGAPFQAFFSADQDKPQRLIDDGLAIPSSRFTYAEGQLVLWSASNKRNLDGGKILQGRFNKLAIANPRLAPYGAAAVEVLENLGLRQATESRWVQGENINQTFQFVSSGNAELGLVALSQVMRHGAITQGSAWIVPQKLYNPIKQDAVILNAGQKIPALAAFWQFMHSEEAAALIRDFGYRRPSISPSPAEPNH